MSDRVWDARFTQELADEICRRSARGEGVRAVIIDRGLDVGDALDWLKENHLEAVRAAKVRQIKARDGR